MSKRSDVKSQDSYYRRAKEVGFRARSAFKLLHLNEEYNLFEGVERAVDLCAAPGSWSQVLSQVLHSSAKCLHNENDAAIVAVDLQEIAPMAGVKILQGDITSERTIYEILKHFDGTKVDLVVSDGAPDVTGIHDMDEYMQAELVYAAMSAAVLLLRPGGVFVAKIFRCGQFELLASQLRTHFEAVSCAKPESSRSESHEAFIIGQGYTPPDLYASIPSSYILPDQGICAYKNETNSILSPYMRAGDLSGFDDLQIFAYMK